MMKNKLMIALVSGALLFTACNSATGPAGATGPKGDAGPTGPQGPAGSTVQQYDFGTKVFTTTPPETTQTVYTIANFTQKQLDTSLILAYAAPIYNSSNKKWYSVPGSTGVNDYITERYDQVNNSNLEIIIKLRSDVVSASQKEYYGSVTWDRFRVIIIPASTVTTLNAKNINYEDYNAVRKHFNLPE